MSGENMEVELAEQKLKTMEHSEQHYFKRYVFSISCEWLQQRKKVPWRLLRAVLKTATLTYYACV